MRNDEPTTASVINLEHEAIAQAYYDRAMAGDHLGGSTLTTSIGARSYSRRIDGGAVLFVAIAPDGSHQAWLDAA